MRTMFVCFLICFIFLMNNITEAQNNITLFPGFYAEIPKIQSRDTYYINFAITREDTYRFTFTRVHCYLNCVYEINPDGDQRRRIDPITLSADFPTGNSSTGYMATAEYFLPTGNYTLQMIAATTVSISDTLQYFTVGYAPVSFTEPLRNMMNGTDPRLASVLQDTALIVGSYGRNFDYNYIFSGNTFELRPIRIDSTIIGSFYSPVVSQDREYISFIQGANFGMNDSGWRNHVSLFYLNVEEAEATRVLSYAAKGGRVSGDDDSGISFSPNGRYLVYHSKRTDDRNYRIRLFDLNTDRETTLTPDTGNARYPSFSPDGQQILFHFDGDNPEYDLYLMDIQGNNLNRLTVGATGTGNYRAQFSPDGSKIAFCSTRDGVRQGNNIVEQLYLMDSDGTNQVRLTFTSVSDCVSTWSPNGQWIAYISETSPVNMVYAISVDGASDYQLLRIMAPSILGQDLQDLRDGMKISSIQWISTK